VHADGSVTVTNAMPVYIAPANPGLFDAPAFPGQARPWPVTQAFHQPGNATDVIDFEGTPTLNNTATIIIQGVTYTYTVNATDVATGLLNTIVQNMVNLINATDQNVTATVGGAFNRIILTAKQAGAAGNGLTVTVSSSTNATVTLTAYNTVTCCLVTPNSPIQPNNPAAPGELIQITGAGLGLVTDPTNVAQGSLGTGDPYNGPVDNTAQNFVTATMGSTTAQVINAQLPLGSYGTYIMQMIVPTTLTANPLTPIYVAQNAFISNTATIPVGSPVLYTAPPPTAPPTTVNELIESPTAGSTVSGTLYAAGWALNSASALTGVSVSIDGQTYAQAQYGFVRTDVCTFYTSPSCPNVGWYLPIDTTQFADGQHTIAITALSANGSDYTVSQSFTISNNANPATDAFHGSIDSPSPNFTYQGVAAFSGWATYANSTIAGVSIYIDGAAEGAATYGGSRTDVCALYPTPGCPAVGWYFQFDTNKIANGSHTLIAKAVSSNGHTFAISQPFQVQNWNGGNGTTQAVIESPSPGAAPFSGTLSIGGWAGDVSTTVTSVGVTVDGVSYGNAGYGFARPDVCSNGTLTNCPNVGFVASLDTTFLADGLHTLAIMVNLAAGQSVTYTQLFSVSNELSAANPLIGNIDTPNPTVTVTGAFPASGWAISKADPITSVALRVDGSSFGNAQYGGVRTDVCALNPTAASCPDVGWSTSLNSALLGNGTHVLEITMSTASGHRASTNTTFNVSNPATGPGHLNIDSPNGASNPFQGLALFSGWAINDNSAVSSVSVTIDGVPYGTATYGLVRTDVCAAYPNRPGCPNVGWSFGLDTTKLTDGQHTFGVTEHNANGTLYTVSQTFLVANYTAGRNPLTINIDAPTTSYGVFGTILISGWAVNTSSPVTTVNVSVDGVPIGTANYGEVRNDVCAVVSGPSCPNVGWSLFYNTQFVPDGTHTLGVTATTSTGQSSTVTEQFIIAN
jgi:hypothetical protein